MGSLLGEEKGGQGGGGCQRLLSACAAFSSKPM